MENNHEQLSESFLALIEVALTAWEPVTKRIDEINKWLGMVRDIIQQHNQEICEKREALVALNAQVNRELGVEKRQLRAIMKKEIAEQKRQLRRSLATELKQSRLRLRALKGRECQLLSELDESDVLAKARHRALAFEFPPVPEPVTTVNEATEVWDLLPDESGVYFAWNDRGMVMYVGQSISIRNRICTGSHHKLQGSDRIGFVLLPRTDLNFAEAFYIGITRPSRNGAVTLNRNGQ